MNRTGYIFLVLCWAATLFSQTDSLQISWNPNPEPDIQEYRLYRAVNSLSNFQILQIIPHPQTHTVDRQNIQPGNLYAFTLTAVDTGGLQSEFSDTVAVGVPAVNWTLSQIVTGQSTSVPLNSFIMDPDDPLSNLMVNVSNSNHLLVTRVNNDLTLTPEPLNYVGTASFLLQVEDTAGFWDQQNIQLQVTAPVNHPPSITSTPVTLAWVDSLYRYQLVASDPDPGETLSFSLISSPAFLNVNSNSGLISGIPQLADTGLHSVTVRVTDAAGAHATQNYNLRVQPRYYPPVITSIPDQIILEGESFAAISLDNYLTDPDDPDSLISWSFSGNVTLSVVINSQRLATIHIPHPEWNGTETIVWRAVDPVGLFDTDTSTFTVLPVNDPPQIISQPVTGATRDSLYRYQVQAFDPDQGDTLTFSLSVAPHFLQIHSRSGLISGIPTLADTGRHNVTVRVQDLAGSSDTQSYLLTVLYQNTPPVIARIPDQTVTEGGSFVPIALDEFVSDQENGDEDLIWSYRANEDLQVLIDNQHIATIQIPDSEWYGVEHVIFRVQDPGGLFDEDTVRFQVVPVNDPPVLQLSELRIEESGSHVIDLKPFAHDVDNSVLELEWEFLDYMHFQFSWEDFTNKLVRIERPGSITFEIGRFVVSDPGGLADTAEVRIIYQVEGANSPPRLVFLPAQLSMEEDDILSLDLFRMVIDSTNLFSELSWQFFPGPELDYVYQSTTGILQIYAQPDWYGNNNFRVRVTDSEGLYDEKTVAIVVKPRVDLLSIDIRAVAPGEVEVAVVADLPNEVSFTCWVTPSLQTTYKSLNYASSHQFILRNLDSDTTYRYFLTLTDTSGFSRTYEQASFRTHLNPSQIGQEEEILVYPNPFRPAKGHSVVVFDNLPQEMTELLIFTPAGETVFEKEIEGIPQRRMPWSVINRRGEQLASGFYIYVVKGENGQKIKSGKLAVIR